MYLLKFTATNSNNFIILSKQNFYFSEINYDTNVKKFIPNYNLINHQALESYSHYPLENSAFHKFIILYRKTGDVEKRRLSTKSAKHEEPNENEKEEPLTNSIRIYFGKRPDCILCPYHYSNWNSNGIAIATLIFSLLITGYLIGWFLRASLILCRSSTKIIKDPSTEDSEDSKDDTTNKDSFNDQQNYHRKLNNPNQQVLIQGNNPYNNPDMHGDHQKNIEHLQDPFSTNDPPQEQNEEYKFQNKEEDIFNPG